MEDIVGVWGRRVCETQWGDVYGRHSGLGELCMEDIVGVWGRRVCETQWGSRVWETQWGRRVWETQWAWGVVYGGHSGDG